MKIFMIGQKGIPVSFGGIERHVEELSTRLAREGNEVFVYARKWYTPKKIKEYKGVNIVHLPTIKTKHLDAIIHTFFASIHVLFQKADVIHYHAIGPALMSWIPRVFKPGSKVVITFHCRDYYHQKWGIVARMALKLGEIIACKVPEETIAVSKTIRQYAYRTYNCKAEYIPNGVPFYQKEKPEIINEKWSLSEQDYILSVSRLVKHKGIHYLIKAYDEICKQTHNGEKDKLPKLVIAGDSSFTDDYVKYIKELAKNNPKIIFTGNVTGKTLAELYSNAYVFIHPSEYEGLSITLLESLAYGCPVLASDIPENKEVIGEGIGFEFENTNTSDLKTKLLNLINNPSLIEEKSKTSQLHAREHYNWEDITRRTIELYKRVTSKKIKVKQLQADFEEIK